MIQVTVARISGYGPWTLTLGPDREHRLQMLQASLYADAHRLFSERGCLVFPDRHDGWMVASNGLAEEEHARIRESLAGKFGIDLRMHAGRGETPYRANLMAHRARRDGVFALGGAVDGAGEVAVMHMDIEGLSARAEDSSPYEVTARVLELHQVMTGYFIDRDSLTFFMGGDNFMVLAGERGRKAAGEFVGMVRDRLGMGLNCGIGRAPTGRQAAMLATRSLDRIREIRDSGDAPKPEVYEEGC